jgi:hypothetical protein
MIDYVLVSNIEEVRLEAEISDGQGKLIATLNPAPPFARKCHGA